MTVTIDHLTTYLKRILKKGNYGQVQIFIKDGEINGVKHIEDFNNGAFIDHVSKPVKTVVVRSCVNSKDKGGEKDVLNGKKVVKNGETGGENDQL